MIDDTSNQLLTQALVLVTHEASKLESVPRAKEALGMLKFNSVTISYSTECYFRFQWMEL